MGPSPRSKRLEIVLIDFDCPSAHGPATQQHFDALKLSSCGLTMQLVASVTSCAQPIISRYLTAEQNMNLLVILSDGEGGPLGRMVEFLGHHDAVALAGACKSLRTTLLGDGNHSVCLGWKAIVLETLLQLNNNNDKGETKKTGFEEVFLNNGENDTIGWYGLSQLIHTNLRKRKVLACLGLATHYFHETELDRVGAQLASM
jgi:hypothetical protein